jgi:HSP20 family protein
MYRLYGMPTAWREMERIRREMNRLFDTGPDRLLRQAAAFPPMNIWSSDEGLVVTAEIPGVNVDDLEITVVNETLTLKGQRAADEINENSRYHRRERGQGRFARSIQLPFPVNSGEVDANMKDGVLYVSLPRAEEDKPRKITVKGS